MICVLTRCPVPIGADGKCRLTYICFHVPTNARVTLKKAFKLRYKKIWFWKMFEELRKFKCTYIGMKELTWSFLKVSVMAEIQILWLLADSGAAEIYDVEERARMCIQSDRDN